MADQRVAVVGYDPAWPDRFAEQRPLVGELLGPWLAGPAEYVGSTAVPGLRAKPVIDMLVPVNLDLRPRKSCDDVHYLQKYVPRRLRRTMTALEAGTSGDG
jgi:GrpB-like predicted nucleotidyltransferase (UPF0157 family)